MRLSGIHAALCIVLVMAGTAVGAEKSGQFSISPMVGTYTIGNPTKSYSTTNVVNEIKAGYNLSEYFGLELNVAYTQTPENKNKNGLVKYGGDVLFHLMPEGDFVPYLALGGGGMALMENKLGGATSANTFIDGGGGIKYQLTDGIALRVDGRVNKITNKTENKQLVVLAGLHFPFGATKSAGKLPESGPAEKVPQTNESSSTTASGETQAAASVPPAEPAPTMASAEPLTQDAGKPAVPADSTAGPATVVAGSVSAEPTGRKTVVTDIIIGKNYIDILVDSPITDYKTLELNKPERLAIYLQSTAWGLAKRFIAVNRFGISNIRIGTYPDSVTIVLDSPDTAFPSYMIEKKERVLRITFTGKPVKKATKKRSSASKK